MEHPPNNILSADHHVPEQSASSAGTASSLGFSAPCHRHLGSVPLEGLMPWLITALFANILRKQSLTSLACFLVWGLVFRLCCLL